MTKREIRKIFDYWNSLNIITHRSIDKHKKHISAALKHYSVNEIEEAMANYYTVLHSKDHYWNYRWPLKDFLLRGIDRFMSENDPLENFRSTTLRELAPDLFEDLEMPPDTLGDFKEKFIAAKKGENGG
jgi:hypothetical protein